MKKAFIYFMAASFMGSVTYAQEVIEFIGVNKVDNSSCQIQVTKTEKGSLVIVSALASEERSVYGQISNSIEQVDLHLHSASQSVQFPDQVFEHHQAVLSETTTGFVFKSKEIASSYEGKSSAQAHGILDLKKGTFEFSRESKNHLDKADAGLFSRVYRSMVPAVTEIQTVSCTGLSQK